MSLVSQTLHTAFFAPGQKVAYIPSGRDAALLAPPNHLVMMDILKRLSGAVNSQFDGFTASAVHTPLLGLAIDDAEFEKSDHV
jgi:hypothetical protein